MDHALVYHVDRQTCNRSLVKAFLAALPDLHFGNVNRYEWSDMSIQVPGLNSQVKTPSIHLKSDYLLHAMSRFCIEWTMWTVKHATGHQSIQLPSSNSQVKAPSIHLKSCFQIDNFNRY